MSVDLAIGEFHPMAPTAMRYIKSHPIDELIKLREAFASCAIEGNRVGEICGETLRRVMENDLVSDRYLLGLYCYMKESDHSGGSNKMVEDKCIAAASEAIRQQAIEETIEKIIYWVPKYERDRCRNALKTSEVK